MGGVIFLFMALLAGVGAASEATFFTNACQKHTCPAGKVCRELLSENLVPFPVAICIRNTSTAKDGPCRQFALATNPLNCKTKGEWERAAIIQCSVREKGMALHQAEVQHVCHGSTGSTPYLRVEITCCPVDVPTSSSSDKLPSEETYPQSDLAENDQADADTVVDSTSSPEPSPYVEPIAYYLPLTLCLFTLALILMVACFVLWRRLALNRRLRKKVKIPRTVYINPDFGEYQVMFYSSKGKP